VFLIDVYENLNFFDLLVPKIFKFEYYGFGKT